MAQLAMVSAQVEIKSSASTLFGLFKEKLPQLPQLLPDSFKSFRFLEGNEIRDGAVIWYKFEVGSTMTTIKVKVELNESSKTAKFILMDGDVLKHYNAFNMKYQMSSGYVKITVEYEKARGSSPNPDAYVSLGSKMIKQLDTYLSRT